MKKILIATLIATFALGLAACSSGTPANSTSSSASSSSITSQNAGLADPWTDVSTAADAAKGAGIDSFTVADGIQLSIGQIDSWTYRCMQGIAEADSTVGGKKITVRKGINPGAGDISGDYNEYTDRWTQDIHGLEVLCYGTSQDRASKILWVSDGYAFSICASNLSSEDVATLVNGIS